MIATKLDTEQIKNVKTSLTTNKMRPEQNWVCPFHILNPLRSFPDLFPAFSRSISLAFNLTSNIICLPTGDISEEDAGEGVIPTGGWDIPW